MNTADSESGRFTSTQYFQLVEEGVLSPDENVELLEGIIVSMPPQTPWHASGIRRTEQVLRRALGNDVLLSSQFPFIVGLWSVPEPDVAVLPGRLEDYEKEHPTSAHLVVEVADSSLPQDRLTKSRIYAHAGVRNFWIVNLRNNSVEWYADPDPDARIYRLYGAATGSTRLPLEAYPEVVVTAQELLPPA